MFQLILHTIPLPVLLVPQKSCFFLKPDLLTSLLVLRCSFFVRMLRTFDYLSQQYVTTAAIFKRNQYVV